MRSGDLRRQVTLQTRSVTRDAANEPVRTWTDLVTVFADIEPLSGRELEIAQAINAEVSHLVSIRYRSNVTTAMRAKYQGRYFNIHSVIDVGTRHELLQLMCSEGLNDA